MILIYPVIIVQYARFKKLWDEEVTVAVTLAVTLAVTVAVSVTRSGMRR